MPLPDMNKRDRRVKWGMLFVSALTLAVLVISALQENVFVQWRQLRLEYADILKAKATDEESQQIAAQFELGVDHIVIPGLKKIDRCITCHTGLDDPRMTDQANPFKTHPGDILENHPASEFGCTVCHEGQGLATNADEAHGDTPHWPTPMLGKQFLYATCAKCHAKDTLYGETGIYATVKQGEANGAELIARGKELMDTKGCLGCHMLNGTGGTLGPDITFVGDKTKHDFNFANFHEDEPHEVPNWLKKHFLVPQEISPGTTMPDMHLTEEEAEALTAYVMSLKHRNIPASHLPKAKVGSALAAEATGEELYLQMCAACHGADGVSSEVPGIRSVALNNVDTLAVVSDDYLRAIIAQGRSGTAMPSWGESGGNLSRDQIDRIVGHIRGWEADGAPVAQINAYSGDAAMGAAYYRGLCANCHGNKGEGGIGNTLNSPTFLAIASDAFLATTIIEGRPNTAMASWRHLPAQAVSDLIAHIRSWQVEPPDFEEVRSKLAAAPFSDQAEMGESLFQGNCAGCHGKTGEGGIGPRLNSQDILPAMSNEFLYRTIVEGRPTTAMPAWRHLSADQVAELISYMRSWQGGRRIPLSQAPRRGDYELGAYHYRVSCQGCHGEDGRGGVGPQLANRAFLSAASDDLLYRWIALGRTDTPMKGFLHAEQGITQLTPEQISDVIAYLRHAASRAEQPILRTGVGDPHVGRQLFVGSCSGCHGIDGEGASGPQLHNRSFLSAASDGFLAATIALGRTGTPMQSMIHGQEGLGQIEPKQVQDIIAYMRYWDISETWKKPRAVAEMSKRAIDSGRTKFTQFCSGCHGPQGRGERDGPEHFAPALNNPEFLGAASDGFLLATIARGRSNTPMRPFGNGAGGIAGLDASDISDIVSYIRTWQQGQMPQGDSSL